MGKKIALRFSLLHWLIALCFSISLYATINTKTYSYKSKKHGFKLSLSSEIKSIKEITHEWISVIFYNLEIKKAVSISPPRPDSLGDIHTYFFKKYRSKVDLTSVTLLKIHGHHAKKYSMNKKIIFFGTIYAEIYVIDYKKYRYCIYFLQGGDDNFSFAKPVLDSFIPA